MRKALLTSALAVAALSVYAEDPTYNFFDPADCDAEGWLWLDTPEKIAKYVGEGKKIQLINPPYEIEDPDFPGETLQPLTTANAELKGYNTNGEEGGEDSKTGGITCPPAEDGWYVTYGGGILVQMPDCASFDLYISQAAPNIYTWVEGAKGMVSAADCTYIWNYDDPSWFYPDDAPLSTNHVAWDMNIQDLKYDLSAGEGEPEYHMIYGPKGEARTAAIYTHGVESPMLIQGIRIKTFTDVSMNDTSVDGIVAGADLKIEGKVVTASAPVEIAVYNAAGAKVAGAYGTSLDCSALKGVYIVKAGAKSVKAVF